MLIYNKTNQVQELRVRDHHTGRNYSVYVGANSSMDIHYSLSIVNMEKLVDLGIIHVVGYTPKKVSTVVPESDSPAKDITEDQDTSDDLEDSVSTDSDTLEDLDHADISEESPVQGESVAESTGFKCTICGGEFASARGLTNHMNKSHKNDLPEEV